MSIGSQPVGIYLMIFVIYFIIANLSLIFAAKIVARMELNLLPATCMNLKLTIWNAIGCGLIVLAGVVFDWAIPAIVITALFVLPVVFFIQARIISRDLHRSYARGCRVNSAFLTISAVTVVLMAGLAKFLA